jgi:hypothetical protein
MVSSNGVVGVLGANACTAQAYSLTLAKAHARHNHADGSG